MQPEVFFRVREKKLEEAMGQKFVPKTSRNERFLAEFVTASPLEAVPRGLLSLWGPKTPFKSRQSPKRGGVPFRPEPFLAIFREKWPKTGPE